MAGLPVICWVQPARLSSLPSNSGSQNRLCEQWKISTRVDIFHCSQRRFWEPEFEGSELNLAGWTQQITGKPAITVGSVGLDADFTPKPGEAHFKEADPASLDTLLHRLDQNEFDLVAVGRALISNPDWVNLVEAKRMDDLKPFRKEHLGELI